MEAFSLLKYWRASSSSPSLPPGAPLPPSPDALTTTVPAAADSTSDDNSDDGDDGPFFDLEFTVPDDTEDDTPDNLNANHTLNEEEEQEDDDDDVCSDGEEGEFKFTLSPSTNEAGDPNLSPSEDLFFKGKLVKVEPLITSSDSEPNNSKPPPQFTASLLKSATKFRVFMSTLKKNKPSVSDKDSNSSSDAPTQTENPPTESQKKPQENQQQQQKKLFTVKFKIEEVPIMSLFTRDNSSKGTLTSKTQKQNTTEDSSHSQQSLSSSSSSDEKRFSKEVMQKYLKMVKPLYIKVSKRYGGKLKFSGQLNVTSRVKLSRPKAAPPAAAAAKNAPAKPVAEKVVTDGDGSEVKGNQKQGNIPAGLKVVCKHLGKSRSASAAVAAAPAGSVSSRRRDDSLLQQQDGIQGAILHCKRSFNAPREGESSQLPRSVSDPLHETSSSPELSRKSLEKGKDKTCP